ncbi:hypothetical protein BJY24_006372 [Nocardia transvalensis]|uniref:Uncharacterized protein n=1 Tax=Nocardia transvalensis TaxID=37333 RepID=A0A7W9UM67_9NOCA|nr:hypothetical protein [Nocardia transvalensis]
MLLRLLSSEDSTRAAGVAVDGASGVPQLAVITGGSR